MLWKEDININKLFCEKIISNCRECSKYHTMIRRTIMKKLSLVSLAILTLIIFSFNAIDVKAVGESSEKLAKVKEIRQSIKHHQKTNKKIESDIERKSMQVEKILNSITENSLVSQQFVEEQLNQKLEGIMTDLMKIGEYETAAWKHLKIANKQIKAKKYDTGIKHLSWANENLQNKHEALIVFDNELDILLTFLKSLQYK
jgi:hypothetical protein